jgi:hypothetical protein
MEDQNLLNLVIENVDAVPWYRHGIGIVMFFSI